MCETGSAEDHRHLRPWLQLGQGQGRRAGRSDDRLLRVLAQRHPELLEPGAILIAVRTRVVGHVDDAVAGLLPALEHGRDAGDRPRTAIDDSVKVNEQQHAAMV